MNLLRRLGIEASLIAVRQGINYDSCQSLLYWRLVAWGVRLPGAGASYGLWDTRGTGGLGGAVDRGKRHPIRILGDAPGDQLRDVERSFERSLCPARRGRIDSRPRRNSHLRAALRATGPAAAPFTAVV